MYGLVDIYKIAPAGSQDDLRTLCRALHHSLRQLIALLTNKRIEETHPLHLGSFPRMDTVAAHFSDMAEVDPLK